MGMPIERDAKAAVITTGASEYDRLLANSLYGRNAIAANDMVKRDALKTQIDHNIHQIESYLEILQDNVTEAFKLLAGLKIRIEQYEQQNAAPGRD
jgi:hypothetical protein